MFFLGNTRADMAFISRVDRYPRAFFSDAPSILQHAVNIRDQLITQGLLIKHKAKFKEMNDEQACGFHRIGGHGHTDGRALIERWLQPHGF